MELSAFFLFALVASITPGPSNVLLTTVGAQIGIIRGLPTLIGTALGTGLILFIVGVGLGISILENEMLLFTLRAIGMAAILWLAWVIATSPVPDGNTRPESALKFGFLTALLLQWINPKAWIVSVSIVGAFMVSDGSVLEQATLLSIVFISAAVIGCLPWLACGAVIGKFLQDPAISRLFNLTLGLSLAGSMITLI